MKLERVFSVATPTDRVYQVLANEETLLGLFPDAKNEVIDRSDSRMTVRSRYRALGRDGEATFHFTWSSDGNLSFEKVCNGNVWKQLRGEVTASGSPSGTRVRIQMEGRTKTFVPEITIKLPMEMQLDEMAAGLRAQLEATD